MGGPFDTGLALLAQDRPEEALAAFDEAIRLDANSRAAWQNRGIALLELARDAEAVASLERAVALAPQSPEAHWNLAFALLRNGDLPQGWREYEWRRLLPHFAQNERALVMPAWRLREDVRGRSVLVRAEQGLGDTIQFSRFVPWLAAQGAAVVLEVPRVLAGVMAGLPGIAQLVPQGTPLPVTDLHCPLPSLALAAQLRGDRVVVREGYLEADAARMQAWRDRLPPAAGKRIGLVWSGRPGHRNDARRSIALDELLRALPAGPMYVSVQKDLRDGEGPRLAAANIVDAGPGLRDFADTAALCSVLDAVVAVDTSVAHLAGALGRPVHLLLPFAPDWRWGREGDATPWYPSMRLWRQSRRGDWSTPLSALAAHLRA